MDTVQLKNGTEEAKPLVVGLMITLKELTEEPIVLYELVECCKDKNHKPFGNSGDKLEELNLWSSAAGVHDSTRNVILSAIEGEGLGLTLVNPIAPKKDK